MIHDMASYDTNLAAEFHVLSCLHRLRCKASLTLGIQVRQKVKRR
jgi:hypothetical protein